MNKIYLSAMAIAIAGSSFAQHAVTKDGNALRDGFMPIHGAQHHNSQINNDDRAVVLWSETFESTSPNVANWSFANTSLPTLDWTIGNTVSPQPSYGHELNSTTGNMAPNTGNIAWINSDGAGANNTQDAELIYGDDIDLSTSSAVGITIRWQQFFRVFYDEHYLSISKDGGNTWTETQINMVGVNVDSDQPGYFSQEITALVENTPGMGDYSSNVRVKLRYKGNYDWFWYVDDIEIIETPDHEIDLIGANYGTDLTDYVWGDHVNYGVINEAQASGVLGYYQGRNKGANAESNIVFSTDFGGNSVSSPGVATVAIGDTARDTSAIYTLVGTAPYNVTVDHSFTYDSIALDEETFNNTLPQVSFDVDPNLYALDNGVASSGAWNGAGNPYTYAAMYDIHNNATLTAIRIALHPNTAAGAQIYPIVIQADPAAADFQGILANIIYDGSLINQVHTVTAGDISAGGGAAPTWLDLELMGATTPGLDLAAGNSYIIGIGVIDPATNGDAIILTGTNTPLDAHYFLYDANGSGNGNVQWFWTGSAAMIRANFDSNLGEVASINDVESGLTLGQNMPNPANGVTNISYSIANTNNITMTIVDVTGKVVKTINEGNKGAGEYTLSIDTEEFSKGVYFYTLTAGNQKLTNRMVVTK